MIVWVVGFLFLSQPAIADTTDANDIVDLVKSVTIADGSFSYTNVKSVAGGLVRGYSHGARPSGNAAGYSARS